MACRKRERKQRERAPVGEGEGEGENYIALDRLLLIIRPWLNPLRVAGRNPLYLT